LAGRDLRRETVTRREWLASIAATPLAKAASESDARSINAPSAPVAIGKASSYDDDVTGRMKTMFDQLAAALKDWFGIRR